MFSTARSLKAQNTKIITFLIINLKKNKNVIEGKATKISNQGNTNLPKIIYNKLNVKSKRK